MNNFSSQQLVTQKLFDLDNLILVIMNNDRYDRGFEKLKEIDGEAGKRVLESFKDISPDFAKYIIEFPFGDIYSRTGLDLKSREIATVAALVTIGNALSQLKVHIIQYLLTFVIYYYWLWIFDMQ
jgi:alkylhydroperoxidase/carboxymuconolactone decarboxylase family protein YurZ